MQLRTPAPHRHSAPQPRPSGELLWIHATTPERYLALCDIGQRLKSLRPDLSVLASWDAGLRLTGTVGCDLPIGPLAEDTAAETRAFLNHCSLMPASGPVRRSAAPCCASCANAASGSCWPT